MNLMKNTTTSRGYSLILLKRSIHVEYHLSRRTSHLPQTIHSVWKPDHTSIFTTRTFTFVRLNTHHNCTKD